MFHTKWWDTCLVYMKVWLENLEKIISVCICLAKILEPLTFKCTKSFLNIAGSWGPTWFVYTPLPSDALWCEYFLTPLILLRISFVVSWWNFTKDYTGPGTASLDIPIQTVIFSGHFVGWLFLHIFSTALRNKQRGRLPEGNMCGIKLWILDIVAPGWV